MLFPPRIAGVDYEGYFCEKTSDAVATIPTEMKREDEDVCVLCGESVVLAAQTGSQQCQLFIFLTKFVAAKGEEGRKASTG